MKSALHLIIALLLIGFVQACSCSNRHPYEYQPNVRWGGRVVALTKSPLDDRVIIAGAESGGLFISKNAGSDWQHIELPVFEITDVKFYPYDEAIVIATADLDLKQANGGGIWRSADGGKTWMKPPTSIQQMGGASAPSWGGTIAFDPPVRRPIEAVSLINRTYVGTGNGLAISLDAGLTWRYTLSGLTILSVVAPGRGVVIASTTSGLFRSEDGGTTWASPVTGGSNMASIRGFAVSPLTSRDIFMVNQQYQILYSSDTGKNWMVVDTTGGGGREGFLRCTVNANRGLSLYFGNGIALLRRSVAVSSTGVLTFVGSWATLPVDHADPSDLIFDSNRLPLLLSGDGGVFRTPDGGTTWNVTGAGAKGLNALQITEVTAQESFVKEQTHYAYFATQDNELWASSDAGQSWPTSFPWEGFSLQTRRRSLLPTGNLITFTSCGACGQYVSDPGFSGVRVWNPPGTPINEPVIWETDLLDSNPPARFVQLSSRPSLLPFSITRRQFNQTLDGGATWRRMATMDFDPTAQLTQISDPTGSSVMYQAVGLSGVTPQGWGRIGLIRLSSPGSAGPLIERADLNGFGSLGIFPTMFKWYNVFAVNPRDVNHLLMADIADSRMKVSWDGGKNWFADDELTRLVTRNGALKLYDIVGCCPKSLVTHIRFNYDKPDQIAVGTRENGIIYSEDRGEGWYKLKDTDQITNVSSIFFFFDEQLLVSSYGRGLWKFKPVAEVNRFRPDQGIKGAFYVDIARRSVVRFRGLDSLKVRLVNKAITAKPQTLRQLLSGPRSVTLQNAVEYALNGNRLATYTASQLTLPKQDPVGNEAADQLTSYQNLPVRAYLVGPANTVAGVIVSPEPYVIFTPDEAAVKSITQPYITVLNGNQHNLFAVEEGQPIELAGYNFLPTDGTQARRVRVLINEKVYEANVPVSAQGYFRLTIRLPNTVRTGVRLLVEQENGNNPIREARFIQLLRKGDERKGGARH